MMIPFNKPYCTGNEIPNILEAVALGKISGNGDFTHLCHQFFEKKWGLKKVLLTTSCTDALEMCALLLNIKFGDEIVVPSYTFVSSALAFIRQGAKIVFADSRIDHPGIDEDAIERLINHRTKAIVVVHYAGVACDMDKIMDIASRHNLSVVEDAAQAIDSYFIGKNGRKRALGSIGHLATFSFHETKNIQCGEGGLLVINDDRFIKRAEIIWEKGTNRAEFFRGETNKYNWVDVGSSFLPSEITAAFLWAQLDKLNEIQLIRKGIWSSYFKELKKWAAENEIELPYIPPYATNNYHMFYLVCRSNTHRDQLINQLRANEILAVHHYLSLHQSPYYKEKHDGRKLPESDRYTNCLLRLPLFVEMKKEQILKIGRTLKGEL